MGARAYIIKEVEDNKFVAVYSHYGANRVYEWARQFLDNKTLYGNIEKLWEESIVYEKVSGFEPLIYNLNSIEELYEFIDFERIDIESYPILWRDGEITIFITLVRSFVNGAIRYESRKEYNPYSLSRAYTDVVKACAIIDFLQVMGYKRVEAEKLLREAWSKMKKIYAVSHELIVAKKLRETVNKYLTVPLRTIE